MSTWLRNKLALAVGVAAVLVSGTVLAQREAPKTKGADRAAPANTRQPARPAAANTAGYDSQLASWLLVDNEGEVALAQLAEEKSENEDVKDFAKQMIKDHGEMINKLQKVAGSQG